MFFVAGVLAVVVLVLVAVLCVLPTKVSAYTFSFSEDFSDISDWTNNGSGITSGAYTCVSGNCIKHYGSATGWLNRNVGSHTTGETIVSAYIRQDNQPKYWMFNMTATAASNYANGKTSLSTTCGIGFTYGTPYKLSLSSGGAVLEDITSVYQDQWYHAAIKYDWANSRCAGSSDGGSTWTDWYDFTPGTPNPYLQIVGDVGSTNTGYADSMVYTTTGVDAVTFEEIWPDNEATTTTPSLGATFVSLSELYTTAHGVLVDSMTGQIVYSTSTDVSLGENIWVASTSVSLSPSAYQWTVTLEGSSILVMQRSETTIFTAGYDFWELYSGQTGYDSPSQTNPWAATQWQTWTGSTSTATFSFNPLSTAAATSTDATTTATMDVAWSQTKQWFDLIYLIQTKFPFSWVVETYSQLSRMASSTFDSTGADFPAISVSWAGVSGATSTADMFSTTTISYYYDDDLRQTFKDILTVVVWASFCMFLWRFVQGPSPMV